MTRLSTGVPGFDALIDGGLPQGTSVVLQGPPGQEKLALALSFLADGLKSGASGILVTASQAPTTLLETLRGLGVDVDLVAKENRLRIVDWYSWSEKVVQEIEEHGVILTTPMDLAQAGTALSRAIVSLTGDAPKRAVVEMLSPALGVFDTNQVYAFAQSSKRKFERFALTALFLLEKDMHTSSVLTTMHQPFDGVIEIERARKGDRIIRKIGVLSLKDTTPDSAFFPLEFGTKGLSVGPTAPPAAKPKAAAPLPLSAPTPSAAPTPGTRAPTGGIPSVPKGPEDRANLRRRVQSMADLARERLRHNPEDADALFALAAAEAVLGSAAVAIELLDRLQARDENYPGLWDLKAKLYAGLGDAPHWEEARRRSNEAYEKSLEEPAEPVPCRACGEPVPRGAETCPLCGVAVGKEGDLLKELDSLARSATDKGATDEEGTELGPAFWDELAALAAVEPALALEKPGTGGTVQELVEPEAPPEPPAPTEEPRPEKGFRGRKAGRETERPRKARAAKAGARGRFTALMASPVMRFGIPIGIAALIVLLPMLFLGGGPGGGGPGPGQNQHIATATPSIRGLDLNPPYGDIMNGTALPFQVVVAQNSYVVSKSIRPMIAVTNLTAGADIVLTGSFDNVTYSFTNPTVTQSAGTFIYDFGSRFEQNVAGGATGASAPSWYFQLRYAVTQVPVGVITWSAQFVSG